jgi:hypothetical protein
MGNQQFGAVAGLWRKWLPAAKACRPLGDVADLLRGPEGVDPAWYRKTYPDIGPDMDPIEHYAHFGWREGRSPNQWFSSAWYVHNYPDVPAAGADPLRHFLREGRKQGRFAAPYEIWCPLAWLKGPGGVDADWYLERYPGLDRGIDAAAHYAEHGWREGKDPNPDFSTAWYLAANPDVAAVGINPLVHYLEHGRIERRRPKPTLLETLRVADWWIKLAPIAAAIFATAYQLEVSLLSLAPVLLLAWAALMPQAAYVALINDLTDRSEDLASGQRNGSLGRSPRAIALMLACCIVPGLLLAFYWRRDLALVGLYVAGWAAFAAYSLPPVRLKSREIWGAMADAAGAHLFPTLLGVLLVYRWQATAIDPVWFMAVAVWSFCYGLRGILWHQLIDRENDSKSGVRTFVQTHRVETLRLFAHLIFAVEIGALGCMLWLISNSLPIIFLALYLLVEWWCARLGAHPVILVPREGKATREGQHRLVLFQYYEFFLPLGLLLGSSLRHPADALIAILHVLIFSIGTLRRGVTSLIEPLARFYALLRAHVSMRVGPRRSLP